MSDSDVWQSITHFLATATVTITVLLLIVMVLAYRFRHLQDAMVYHPMTPEDSTTNCMTPTDFGMTNWETIQITTVDKVRLRGYMMRPEVGSGPVTMVAPANGRAATGSNGQTVIAPHEPLCTLVYFHGNAGNVGHRLPIARLLISQLRCVVLMVDYRGYGLSDRVDPTEEGLKIDAQATMDFVLSYPRIPKERIFILGTSLGGAVAIDLLSRPLYSRAISGAILENTFTSISDMADSVFTPFLERAAPQAAWCLIPFLQRFVKPLIMFVGWWSEDIIRKVSCPLLFLSGSRDELVPQSQMKRLHEVAVLSAKSSYVQFVDFPMGKHNDLFTMKGYCQAIETFVKEVLSRREIQVA